MNRSKRYIISGLLALAVIAYIIFRPKSDLIGYIHYDGEVRFDTLNNKANDQFLKAIKKTTFEDTGRENSKRSR